MKDLIKEEFQQKPRGKGNHRIDVGMRDYYTYYRKKSKFQKFTSKFNFEKSTRIRVNEAKYCKVLKDFFKECAIKVLKGEKVTLPCNYGYIRVQKNKPKRLIRDNKVILPINWKESKRLKKRVYHTNDSRDGYIYKITWEKRGYHRGITWYKYIPSRDINRTLAKLLEDKSVDYLERKHNIK